MSEQHHPVGNVLADRTCADDDDVVRRGVHGEAPYFERPRRRAETRKKIPPRAA